MLMGPLDDLAALEKLLRRAGAAEVRAELARLDTERLVGAKAAARDYATGALALREGQLDDACASFEAAGEGFRATGEPVAAALCDCELWLARIRKGPKAIYAPAIAALAVIAESDERIVRVVAMHYQGTALRYSGRAEETQRMLLAALAQADGLLAERAKLLNSLGTLFVVVGAYGAARALLEHAADLNQRLGDSVGEAISCGQLGSAALALGEPEAARRHLQRQEWLASEVGDRFGRARALVLLADLAIDLERPDDAIDLAEQARAVASAAQPPLAMWIAYASRSIGRAKLELGHESARLELEAARERFQAIGNQLGEALVTWDLAQGGSAQDWSRAAWALASLGLGQRVAQLLCDRSRQLAQDEVESRHTVDLALAACAQVFPELNSAHEIDLVYNDPATLGGITARRLQGQRNLGRLAALAIAPAGLTVAALVSGSTAIRVVAKDSHAALIGQVGSLAVWAWPWDCSAHLVARDLARASEGASDFRAAIAHAPEARIASIPLAGESGATVAGIDVDAAMARAFGAANRTVWRDPALGWSDEATLALTQAGLAIG